MQHLVDAGLLVENERIVMEQFNSRFTHYSKHWMPIVWAASIVTRARKEKRIHDDFAVKTLIDELNIFRGKAGLLISYDTISIPLVYTVSTSFIKFNSLKINQLSKSNCKKL